MPGIDRWKISPETRAKFTAILDEAPRLGIDRVQAVAVGLPGLRALIGLKKAVEAGTRKARNLAFAETRDALRGVARRNSKLASQFEARILALQGRGSDTEVVHVARGEMVVPQALQNPEVVAALRRAAAAHGVPVEMLLVGNARNRINPETGAAEFAPEGVQPEDAAARAGRIITENPVWQGAINQKDKPKEGDGSFGSRRDPIKPGDPPRSHQGIDIQGTAGEPVYAAGDGKVIRADGTDKDGYGNQVWIDHGNGVVTQVGHLNDIHVTKGDVVRAGQAIGRVGRTGNAPKEPRDGDAHAHFEVRVDGVRIDPGPLVPGLNRRLPP